VNKKRPCCLAAGPIFLFVNEPWGRKSRREQPHRLCRKSEKGCPSETQMYAGRGSWKNAGGIQEKPGLAAIMLNGSRGARGFPNCWRGMDTAKPEIDLLPFNVWSRSEEEIGRLMSNFARTPFELDGVAYASFEGFYISLLFLDPAKRLKLSRLYGLVVSRMGKRSKIKRDRLKTCYAGGWFDLGSETHLRLVKRALRAKLEAHPNIARAFVATKPRSIAHETGHPHAPDVEFPASVFCRILSELSDEFAALRVERPHDQ
jgi:hypothetical protein